MCFLFTWYSFPMHFLCTSYPFPSHLIFISYSFPMHVLFTAYSFPIHFIFILPLIPIHSLSTSHSFLFISYSSPIHFSSFHVQSYSEKWLIKVSVVNRDLGLADALVYSKEMKGNEIKWMRKGNEMKRTWNEMKREKMQKQPASKQKAKSNT